MAVAPELPPEGPSSPEMAGASDGVIDYAEVLKTDESPQVGESGADYTARTGHNPVTLRAVETESDVTTEETTKTNRLSRPGQWRPKVQATEETTKLSSGGNYQAKVAEFTAAERFKTEGDEQSRERADHS